MRAIKITHFFPEETIKLESGRELSKMSEEDLLWCFGAEVIFKSFSSETILLELEVALFDFLTRFLEVILNYSNRNSFEEVFFDDPYDMYALELSRIGDEIKIADNYSHKSITINMNELIIAFEELVITCIETCQKLFPELLKNRHYIEIKEKLVVCRSCRSVARQ